ncbi:MAG: autoinducer 2 ABC transporter substrate-binding protein [Propionibacteriaceae bacterium]|nr:autoinducer 2 ABC transporter substrate-binding protein [Propionibacteriaceae bacterium]
MTHRNIHRVAVGLSAVLALSLTACATQSAPAAGGSAAGNQKFVTVVKLQGIAWFDRMQVGLDQQAKEIGATSTMVGPDDASPEKQVKIIQDLIAQKPAAIAVIPLSPQALEGVLGQARAAGIKVITHEAPSQTNTDLDIEAFDNAAYGQHLMDKLAECMGGQGEYVTMVGSLTAESHMKWAQAELDQAKAKYSGITRVADPIETKEDLTQTYEKTKEILAKYPNIKGFLGSAASDVAGIGRAISEAGLQDKTCVLGTSIPSTAGKYLKDGSVDAITFWDPKVTGQVLVTLQDKLARGEKVGVGTNLGITGYENLQATDGKENVLHGNAWIDVTNDNVADYNF